MTSVGVFLLALAILVSALGQRMLTVQVLGRAVGDVRVIGSCLRAYGEKHGCFPSSLRELVNEGIAHDELMHSAFRSHVRGDGFDYAYVAGLLPNDPGNWPIVYELPDVRPGEGRLVLYVSGDVHALDDARFAADFDAFCSEFTARKGHAPAIVCDR